MATLLIGCGSDSGSNSGNKPQETSDTHESIVGIWEVDCHLADYDEVEGSVWDIERISITETQITRVVSHYDDDSCSVPYSGSANLWNGSDSSYVAKDTIMSDSGLPVQLIDVTYVVNSPDQVVEFTQGFYVKNDVLYLAYEYDGAYGIIFSLKYYKK